MEKGFWNWYFGGFKKALCFKWLLKDWELWVGVPISILSTSLLITGPSDISTWWLFLTVPLGITSIAHFVYRELNKIER